MAIRTFSIFSVKLYEIGFKNNMKSMELTLPTSEAQLTEAGTTITCLGRRKEESVSQIYSYGGPKTYLDT